MATKKGTSMSRNDILELLDLKGWSQAQLARELGLHESSISLWLSGERNPMGPAKILMRQWLDQERGKAQPA